MGFGGLEDRSVGIGMLIWGSSLNHCSPLPISMCLLHYMC